MKVEINNNTWLKRTLRIEINKYIFNLEYNGRGLGKEEVMLNGVSLNRQSSITWFAPTFEIKNNNDTFKVEIRVWPWLSIRSMYVFLNNDIIYKEGAKPYKVSATTENINLYLFFALMVGPIYLFSKMLE